MNERTVAESGDGLVSQLKTSRDGVSTPTFDSTHSMADFRADLPAMEPSILSIFPRPTRCRHWPAAPFALLVAFESWSPYTVDKVRRKPAAPGLRRLARRQLLRALPSSCSPPRHRRSGTRGRRESHRGPARERTGPRTRTSADSARAQATPFRTPARGCPSSETPTAVARTRKLDEKEVEAKRRWRGFLTKRAAAMARGGAQKAVVEPALPRQPPPPPPLPRENKPRPVSEDDTLPELIGSSVMHPGVSARSRRQRALKASC